jgi:uncharacterized protein YbcI
LEQARHKALLLSSESCFRANGAESFGGSSSPVVVPREPVVAEAVMNTQGEIEAAICEGMARFEQEYMGRGPKDLRAHLIGDLLVVRLAGVLTAAEQHLVQTLPSEKGRDLLKQVRTQLIELARPKLEELVLRVTGAGIISLHHDVSTVSGEEVVLFTLQHAPVFRDTKKK